MQQLAQAHVDFTVSPALANTAGSAARSRPS